MHAPAWMRASRNYTILTRTAIRATPAYREDGAHGAAPRNAAGMMQTKLSRPECAAGAHAQATLMIKDAARNRPIAFMAEYAPATAIPILPWEGRYVRTAYGAARRPARTRSAARHAHYLRRAYATVLTASATQAVACSTAPSLQPALATAGYGWARTAEERAQSKAALALFAPIVQHHAQQEIVQRRSRETGVLTPLRLVPTRSGRRSR